MFHNHIAQLVILLFYIFYFSNSQREVEKTKHRTEYRNIEALWINSPVNCTQNKMYPPITDRINLLFYLFFHRRPIQQLCFFLVGLWQFNCQLPKPGDRRNVNTHKTYRKCCINNERSTGKKHTNVGWDDGGKIGKIILSE